METLPFSFTESLFPRLILPLIVAYVTSVLGTWLSIRLARRMNHLDHPGERSSHSVPVPRFGGIGIALGLFVALSQFAPNFHATPYGKALWIGALIALGFGLIDDLKALPALLKLALQALCAAIPLILGVTLSRIVVDAGQTVSLGHWQLAVTFVWIVFFMNAYNFMDGMDGQTSTFGILTCLAIVFPLTMTWRVFQQAYDYLLVPVALAGGLLGFLRFNITRPAKSFMGDGGSQMAGFVLALALVASPPAFVLPALLAFWPFVYDVSFTLIRRSLRGKNLFQAHRDHLYQQLSRCGMTHRQVLARTLLFNAVCFAGSLYASWGYLNTRSLRPFYAALFVVLTATVVYTFYVFRRQRRSEASNANERLASSTQVNSE